VNVKEGYVKGQSVFTDYERPLSAKIYEAGRLVL
jgi:hypothetical protein